MSAWIWKYFSLPAYKRQRFAALLVLPPTDLSDTSLYLHETNEKCLHILVLSACFQISYKTMECQPSLSHLQTGNSSLYRSISFIRWQICYKISRGERQKKILYYSLIGNVHREFSMEFSHMENHYFVYRKRQLCLDSINCVEFSMNTVGLHADSEMVKNSICHQIGRVHFFSFKKYAEVKKNVNSFQSSFDSCPMYS